MLKLTVSGIPSSDSPHNSFEHLSFLHAPSWLKISLIGNGFKQ